MFEFYKWLGGFCVLCVFFFGDVFFVVLCCICFDMGVSRVLSSYVR